MDTSYKWLWVMLGLLLALSAGPSCIAAPSTSARNSPGEFLLSAGTASMSAYPGLTGTVHRKITRASNSIERLARFFGQVGVIWLWTLVSIGVFLLVAALSSVADVRMLDFRHRGVQALSNYVIRGIRMFFRIIIDRNTPNLARTVLLVALLYWLVPADLIRDRSILPGFMDDLVIAAGGAKVFTWLCPDRLVAAHAHALDSGTP